MEAKDEAGGGEVRGMTLAQVVELASASTGGPLNFGPLDHAVASELAQKTSGTTPPVYVWTTFKPIPEDEQGHDSLVVAVTGNGSDSRANALFFSVARAHVLQLASTVKEKSTGAGMLAGGLKQFREELLAYDAHEDRDGIDWDAKRIELDRMLQEAIACAEHLSEIDR